MQFDVTQEKRGRESEAHRLRFCRQTSVASNVKSLLPVLKRLERFDVFSSACHTLTFHLRHLELKYGAREPPYGPSSPLLLFHRGWQTAFQPHYRHLVEWRLNSNGINPNRAESQRSVDSNFLPAKVRTSYCLSNKISSVQFHIISRVFMSVFDTFNMQAPCST